MWSGSTVLVSPGPCSRLSAHVLERFPQPLIQIRGDNVPCQRFRHLRPRSGFRVSPNAVNKQDIETDRTTGTTTTDFLEGRGRDLPSLESSEPSTSGGSPARRIPYSVIGALATAGVLETAYLTVSKLTASSVVCPAFGSCDTVLSSSYAEVFGIPLSLFGMAAYTTVAGLAFRAAPREEEDEVLRYALLGGATVLASTSGYLLYILATKFAGQGCTWCFASAAISFSILVATMQGFSKRELREGSLGGGALVTATVLALALAWGDADVSAIGDYQMPYQEPPVTSASTDKAISLAKRLKEAGAQFYGAFWCSHCLQQKQIFGKDASAQLPYVECYPNGYFKGVKLASACQSANLNGFPSWIINGNLIEGEQTLEELERALAQPAAALSP
eukprot:jgi/Botrbrau1/19870/Bobra.0856s0002.2